MRVCDMDPFDAAPIGRFYSELKEIVKQDKDAIVEATVTYEPGDGRRHGVYFRMDARMVATLIEMSPQDLKQLREDYLPTED